MNTAEIERHDATNFIIAETEGGVRVCSPLTPARQYTVTGLPDNPHCTCPEFTREDRNPEQPCEHISAVLERIGFTAEAGNNGPTANGSDLPPARPAKKTSNGRNGKGAVMLLKRSVSPDGRIDSLSVEFSCPVAAVTSGEIKQQAATMLALQGEITSGFLKLNSSGQSNGNGNGKPPGNNGTSDTATLNAVAGQLLAVASMNGKWGRRLFINVLVNGQVLKLFGSEKQLAEAVTGAGFPDVAAHLADALTLNLPCRVVTKPSPDGKYINVERVLPAQAAAPRRG